MEKYHLIWLDAHDGFVFISEVLKAIVIVHCFNAEIGRTDLFIYLDTFRWLGGGTDLVVIKTPPISRLPILKLFSDQGYAAAPATLNVCSFLNVYSF